MSAEDKKDGLFFTAAKLDPSQFENEDACFMKLERFADLLNSPGMIQYEASIDPTFGPKIKEVTSSMLHAAVDGIDFANGPTDECVDVLSGQVQELQRQYMAFISAEAGTACIAMQVLGMKKLILSVESFDKASGVTPEIQERLKEALKRNGGNQQVLAAKPHPTFGGMISAGIRLSGGQEQFAIRQANILKRLPESVRDNPNTSVPGQVCGALLELISERTASYKMVSGTLVGILESVMSAKRFSSFGFIADWAAPADHIVKNILMMAEKVITDRVDDKSIAKNVADDAIEKMMKTATQPGNETKH